MFKRRSQKRKKCPCISVWLKPCDLKAFFIYFLKLNDLAWSAFREALCRLSIKLVQSAMLIVLWSWLGFFFNSRDFNICFTYGVLIKKHGSAYSNLDLDSECWFSFRRNLFMSSLDWFFTFIGQHSLLILMSTWPSRHALRGIISPPHTTSNGGKCG